MLPNGGDGKFTDKRRMEIRDREGGYYRKESAGVNARERGGQVCLIPRGRREANATLGGVQNAMGLGVGIGIEEVALNTARLRGRGVRTKKSRQCPAGEGNCPD